MNKKTFTPRKQAFSLIELSIVLIIIGLLIAGVTGGASLIKNAELRKVAEEARGYQTAVNSFFAKYNALPGDATLAIGTMNATGGTINDTTNGNVADNNIQYVNNSASIAANNWRLESNIAWQQLRNDNFINEPFTPASASAGIADPFVAALVPGTNIPASRSRGGGWFFDNITVNTLTTTTATASNQNVVIISAGVPARTTAIVASTALKASAVMTAATLATSTGNAQLTPSDALSIDTKMDDGIPDTGTITNSYGTTVNTICSSISTNSAAGVGTYSTTNNFRACSLAFRVDPNQ